MQKMASQKKTMHIKSMQKVQCAHLKTGIGDFPSSPVFKIHTSNLPLVGFIPDWETKMSPAAWSSQTEK